MDEIKLIIAKGDYEAHFIENHLIGESIEVHKAIKIYRELGLSGQSFPNHFFMIIEFFGSEYTVMNSKIVYFKKISG